MTIIKGSVGKGGKNNPKDVLVIQKLINYHIGELAPLKEITLDDRYGEETANAIRQFQSKNAISTSELIEPYSVTIQALSPIRYASPTDPIGKQRTSDGYGQGYHGASRGKRKHDGMDIVTRPGKPIYAPLSGIITRLSAHYKDGTDYKKLLGLMIEASDGTTCKIWYIKPLPNIVGRVVEAGKTIIGTSETLQNRYPPKKSKPIPLQKPFYGDMTDHVHVRLHSLKGGKIDPERVIPVVK